MPNVWLVRSPEYSLSRFKEVYDLLDSYKGVLRFFNAEPKKDKDLPGLEHEIKATSKTYIEPKNQEWFFERCNEFRKQEDIGDDEMVLLLTDIPNPNNYFNGIDFETGLNMMVHTADWDVYFPDSHECFPIAYHVVASVLIRQWFNSYNEATQMLNLLPKGCMMDFCKIKKDVKLKILTANISDESINSILEHGVDPNLLRQTLRIFEGIRAQILFGKYGSLIKARPIKLSFKGDKKQIYFHELSNKNMSLPTKQRAIYMYLLKNSTPDTSLHFNDLTKKEHLDGIFDIYNKISPIELNKFDGDLYHKRKGTIQNIFNLEDTAEWEQLVSKTNKALIDFLGEDLAKIYTIQTDSNRAKYIPVDRAYIEGLED